ncbi:MAG: putative DNA binding domain-containing protein [Kiritimatiellae bacterium]|nr:putative DNA binding domain-containing protein [Kiritimatiellia bacterium]
MDMAKYIGEATAYDKKLMLERKEPLSWLKSVSAFANTSGGLLLYGVDNDGNLVGLENAERDAEDISEMIKSLMDPIPEFDLSLHAEDGRKFVVVSVKAGTTTPYYVFIKGHRDAYIRIGNESVKANSIDLKRLVLKGEKRTWDSLPSNHKRTNFAFETLRAEYFARAKMEFVESDFDSFGLVEGAVLTNAGALLADKSPIRHSRVFCTRWNGLTKSNGVMEALDDDEFSGGLLNLLDAAKGFVKVNAKTKWRKMEDGSGRVEYPEYPSAAVEEAIVNGLIHRDYLELGSEVHIDMFDDRMEIYSPGGMISGELIQSLDSRAVASKRRNPVIADLFQRLSLMERRGSGFGKILDAYQFESEKRGRSIVPQFRSSSSEFHVILPNLNYKAPELDALNGDKDKSADAGAEIAVHAFSTTLAEGRNAKVIVRAMRANGRVTILDLCRKTRLSTSGVYKIIAALKAASKIRRIGPTKGGSWEVVE